MATRAIRYSGGVRIVPSAPSGSFEFVGGGRRGTIRGFSPASRRRLRQLLLESSGQLKEAISGRRLLWITLTFPDVRDAGGAKRVLRALVERLRRRGLGGVFIWRLEFQKRGAAHFHALYVVPRPWPASAVASFILSSWLELVPGAVLQAQCIREVESFAFLSAYLSKYLAKVEQAEGWGEVGRWWGICFRDYLVFESGELIPVWVAVALIRAVRRERAKKFLRPWPPPATGYFWSDLVGGLLSEFIDF